MDSPLKPILQRMLRRFELRAPLDEPDRQALLGLPYDLRTIEAAKYIVREGSTATESCLVVAGYAFRHKGTVEGDRQILSLHIPGDFVDLEGALLNTADHNIQTLTRCELAFIPVTAIRDLIQEHPNIARAMWIDTLVDSSIFREWVLNVGQRDARARIAHILCEFARRLEIAGLGSTEGYELPMTQEHLADAAGLTSVHVNRMLKSLEREGLIRRDKRHIGIPDWKKLRTVAGFSELYLHLDQVQKRAVA